MWVGTEKLLKWLTFQFTFHPHLHLEDLGEFSGILFEQQDSVLRVILEMFISCGTI